MRITSKVSKENHPMSSEQEFEDVPSPDEIGQTLEDLAKDGLIAHNGQWRWSERSGCYQKVWVMTPLGRLVEDELKKQKFTPTASGHPTQ
jgi:hypothetical protein